MRQETQLPRNSCGMCQLRCPFAQGTKVLSVHDRGPAKEEPGASLWNLRSKHSQQVSVCASSGLQRKAPGAPKTYSLVLAMLNTERNILLQSPPEKLIFVGPSRTPSAVTKSQGWPSCIDCSLASCISPGQKSHSLSLMLVPNSLIPDTPPPDPCLVFPTLPEKLWTGVNGSILPLMWEKTRGVLTTCLG